MKSNKNIDKDWEGTETQVDDSVAFLLASGTPEYLGIGLIFLVTLAHKINRSIPILVCVCVCVHAGTERICGWGLRLCHFFRDYHKADTHSPPPPPWNIF